MTPLSPHTCCLSSAERRALLEPSLGPSNAAEPSMVVPPVPEPSSPPLASLGPRPGGMDLSLLVTLDVWGPGLLTFDIRQQEVSSFAHNLTFTNCACNPSCHPQATESGSHCKTASRLGVFHVSNAIRAGSGQIDQVLICRQDCDLDDWSDSHPLPQIAV